MITRLTLTEAWRNVLAHRMRSWLSVLSILIGTAALSCMLSIGHSARIKILSEFQSLGTNFLAIHLSPDERDPTDVVALSLAQWQTLRHTQSDILTVAPYGVLSLPLSLNSTTIEAVSLLYADPTLLRLLTIQLAAGRMLSELDRGNSYALIGAAIAHQWATIPADLIGQSLPINNVFFKVVGVLAPWPSQPLFSLDLDQCVIILDQATHSITMTGVLNNALLQLKPKAKLEYNQATLQRYLEQSHPHWHVSVSSAKVLQQAMLHQQQALRVLLGLSGNLILLVGGLGIMNILLVSIIERKREIGLRLSLGATACHIQILFLSEAILLGTTGGTIGGFVGAFAACLIGGLNAWPWRFDGTSILLSISLAIATSLIFGVYPAYQASRLQPIDALRGE